MNRLIAALLCAALPFAGAQAREGRAPKAERFAHCGGFLEGASFDRNGTLWAVDLLGGNIFAIDRNGICTKKANIGGRPNGARFHRDGRLYVADNAAGIVAIDLSTMAREVVVSDYGGAAIKTANDLVFDREGGLYFTDPNGSTELDRKGRVFYLPPGKGQKLRLLADGLIFPNGIALAPDGENILVGQLRDKSILKLPMVTSKAVFQGAYMHIRTNGGMGPDGLALDNANRLYWAEFEGGSVGIADATGKNLPSIILGKAAGRYVTNLAFHDGWLYITEAENGDIWRIKVDVAGQQLYGDSGS